MLHPTAPSIPPAASGPSLFADPRPGSTLLATGRKNADGRFAMNIHCGGTVGTPGPLAALPRRARIAEAVSVRVGHHFLSSAPKVIDDFSASTLLSALRLLQKVRNLDGPDDIASAIPAAFAEANQPYIEIGLLGLLFPLVVVSAVGAVRGAARGYVVDYPEAVRRKIVQQQAMIDALRRDSCTRGGHPVRGETDQELDLAMALHAELVGHYAAGQPYRKRDAAQRLWRNIRNRWQGVAGHGDLSVAFNQEVAEILARRMARGRILHSVDTSYQHHLLEKLEQQRHASKMARTAALFTGVGMPTMAAGMPVSAGAAVATAVGARAARTTLEQATSGVMGAAQLLQGGSGVLNFHLHRRTGRQLDADLAAVGALSFQDGLTGQAGDLYEDESAFRRAVAHRAMGCDATLATGQALMFVSSVIGPVAPPVAAGLAVPGAVLTVAASVLSSVVESRAADHTGAGAHADIQEVESQGNLRHVLAQQGLARTTALTGEAYRAMHARVLQTRMWNDVLQALAAEDVSSGEPPRSGARRHEMLVRHNARRHGTHHLAAIGRVSLAALRDRRYPPAFFDRPLADIHRRLAHEMAAHPHAPAIGRQKAFLQQVLFATAEVLARQPGAAASPLFRDTSGRRVGRIRFDQAFGEYLRTDPMANAVYRQKHNEALARHLTAGDRFALAEHHEALTDLAHTRQRRVALGAAAGVDPGAETSRI